MRLRLCAFLAAALLTSVAGADQGRSIFDEDWTPPKPLPTRQAPTPAPTPPDAPAPPPDAPPPATPPAPRKAVPAQSEQAAVRKVMKEVYAAELADRSAGGRQKLSEALLARADRSAGIPADQFVLLAAALDAAVEAGSLPLAFAAADRMGRLFDVDALAMKVAAATSAGGGAAQLGPPGDNVEAALALADQVAADDDYATALRVCAAVQPSTSGNAALRARVAEKQRELGGARDAAAKVAKDFEKLKATPDDPAANLAIGRYLCFVKGDWEAGLPKLAKGSDTALKALAAQELTHPTSADEVAVLADAWWAAAAKQPAPVRAAVTDHAAALYKRSLDGARGLRREQIEKRIAEATESAARAGRTIKSGKARGPVELLPLMQGNGTAGPNRVVVLERASITTTERFKPPVAFRIVAQTEATDFRIHYAADQIIFNWEGNPRELRIDGGPAGGRHKRNAGWVPQKTWVTIDLVVTPTAMTISVDGEQRHRVEADFSGVDDKFRIGSAVSPLIVKSVQMIRPAQ